MLDVMSDTSTTARTWGPKPAQLAVAGGGGVVFAVLAVWSDDRAGRLLLGLAAAVLLVGASLAAYLRPRLAADADGVTVRGLGGRQRARWFEVSQCEVVSHHRLGRDVAVLELTLRRKGEETLLLFSGVDLGADPVDVGQALHQLRPNQSRS